MVKIIQKISNRNYSRLSYAGFNSTCYHPPRAHPRGFAIFFLLGGLFPTPGHAERDNSQPPGLLIDQIRCFVFKIDFRTIARPDVLTRT